MESYCVFLMGQFIATAQFAHDFGVFSEKANNGKGGWIIEASWQSAFQCSGPIGAFIGVFLAGPITSWIGYRWATIGGLMFLNAFIFIFYFGNSQGMFFRGPDPGRHPVGHFYRQCTRILCRNCANEIESSSDADVADVLGDWVDHSRRYHLPLPIQE